MIAPDDMELNRIPIFDDPQAKLERMYIEEYLKIHGFSLHDMLFLPDDVRHKLMAAACRYASTRLAEIEQRAQFVREIHPLS